LAPHVEGWQQAAASVERAAEGAKGARRFAPAISTAGARRTQSFPRLVSGRSVMNLAPSFLQPSLFSPPIAAWPFGALEPQSYDLIMADPPWRFELYSEKGEGKSASSHYATMSLEAIAALPVGDLARPDCLIWLWATAPMLPMQIEVMAGWGFRYVTSGVWVKKTVNGKTDFGTGYVLRSAHEPFLIGAIGEPQTSRSVRSVVEGQRREHSRKPDAAYRAAEALVPGNVRRCDLFSRESRVGWEAWGQEAGKFDDEGNRQEATGKRGSR
jgi:N6-adenosine-specific RNA methylase IME4